jgi:hypothetical protein
MTTAGKKTPALSIDEIAGRLVTLARRLRQAAENGAVDVDEIGFVAKKLRTYAIRLRAATIAPPPLERTSTHQIGQSPTARVRIRVNRGE